MRLKQQNFFYLGEDFLSNQDGENGEKQASKAAKTFFAAMLRVLREMRRHLNKGDVSDVI